jgi:hypothetical protein
MALTPEQVFDRVSALKYKSQERDARMGQILDVRKGNLADVYPDMFPPDVPKPMVANFVDIAARDIAELLAPLPSFNCSVYNSTNDKARAFADKRTLIANNYVQHSRLQTQMYTGADWYVSYGFLPFVVDPDMEAGLPRIRIDNPLGAYPEFDRFGRLISYTKRYMKTVGELVAEFPEYERAILGPYGRTEGSYSAQLELIRYEDADQIMLYIPARENTILSYTPNPIGEMLTRVAVRPGIDSEPRGQFDDVLWVQLARARFSSLALEAAEKSVQAPLALPNDVQEFSFGPDAVIRSSNPAGIGRVQYNVPPAVFTESQLLQSEMRLGSRYPEGRSGNIDASIITGQGVQALLGAFDTQIKTGQQILAETFQEVMKVCFRMDELIFDFDKTVNGVSAGAPYEIKYKPSRDIKKDYNIEVRYGLMSGLDPGRALIFALQALGANLVSRDFVMRELPWSMNVTSETERIEIEKLRDSLNGSINALTQAIPQMAVGGQDPTPIVEKVARVIDSRRKGMAIEDAVMQTFAPAPAPVTPEGVSPVEQTVPSAPAAAPSGASPEMQAQPDLMTLMAGISGAGSPQMSARVQRQQVV